MMGSSALGYPKLPHIGSAQATPSIVNGDGGPGVAKRQELQQKLERLQQQQEQLAGSPDQWRFDPHRLG